MRIIILLAAALICASCSSKTRDESNHPDIDGSDLSVTTDEDVEEGPVGTGTSNDAPASEREKR